MERYCRDSEKSRGRSRAGAAAVLPLLVLMLLTCFSCKRKFSFDFPEAPAFEPAAGAGLEVSARFVSYPVEVEDLFHGLLPDSGVVPVQVRVRNNDTHRVLVHSASAMGLDRMFEGFTLRTGDGKFPPMHPLDVLKRMIGEERAVRYRRTGRIRLVAGVALFPPSAGYFIHKEVTAGKHHRSIFNNSIYHALPGRIMEPLVLEPGREAEGYLFFSLPPGRNPYVVTPAGGDATAAGEAGRSIRTDGSFELGVVGSFAPEGFETLPFRDLVFAREEAPQGEPAVEPSGAERGRGTLFFALESADGSEGGKRLVIGKAEDLAGRSYIEVARVSAKKASIADASVFRGRAACALNYKSKSRVFLVGTGDGREIPIRVSTFPKRIRRVLLNENGVFVVTRDGFCRFIPFGRGGRVRKARLGPDVGDAALRGGRLLVLHGKRGLSSFGAYRSDLLKPLENNPMTPGMKKVIRSGPGNPDLTIIAAASSPAGCDTIVVLDYSDATELERRALPGRVLCAFAGPGDLLLQLENGALLRLAAGEGTAEAGRTCAGLTVREAAYLPFRLMALSVCGDRILAVGEGGELVDTETLADFSPGVLGAVEAVTDVPPPVVSR